MRFIVVLENTKGIEKPNTTKESEEGSDYRQPCSESITLSVCIFNSEE